VLVTLQPGVSRGQLRDSLRAALSDVVNLRGGGGPDTAYGRLLAYLEWAASTTHRLGNQISSADLDRLVLTRGYERLLAGIGNMTATDVHVQRIVNGLVARELAERAAAFNDALMALEGQIQRWPRLGTFIVPDSSFYIHHPKKLEEADFALLVGARGQPIHVLVPIVVIDELDKLKESRVDKHVRWRAGYTLAVLDRVFASGVAPARLRAEDSSALRSGGIPQGEVTIELLFDPPDHVRLPINDDEIIDRCLAAQPLAARDVMLITYDTGQSTRARAAGLQVTKLRSAELPD
jgi:rRNA-processing protein FCF1